MWNLFGKKKKKTTSNKLNINRAHVKSSTENFNTINNPTELILQHSTSTPVFTHNHELKNICSTIVETQASNDMNNNNPIIVKNEESMIESYALPYHIFLNDIRCLLCKPHKNTISNERFRKLIHWLDFNDSFLHFLSQAWFDECFWPFLSTSEAANMVQKSKARIVIRLSNQVNGTITVTRNARILQTIINPVQKLSQQRSSFSTLSKNTVMVDMVKHKRYFPSVKAFGKLILTGAKPARDVDWNGLLAYLKQDECCICLEELRANVFRMNCGHHFHVHCINQHMNYSQTCPLCRHKISSAKEIHEPEIVKYEQIPNFLLVENEITLDDLSDDYIDSKNVNTVIMHAVYSGEEDGENESEKNVVLSVGHAKNADDSVAMVSAD